MLLYPTGSMNGRTAAIHTLFIAPLPLCPLSTLDNSLEAITINSPGLVNVTAHEVLNCIEGMVRYGWYG